MGLSSHLSWEAQAEAVFLKIRFYITDGDQVDWSHFDTVVLLF